MSSRLLEQFGYVQERAAVFMLRRGIHQDIESAFKDVGLSLFPEKLKDLTTEYSCPDWSNPCKHIAAVYYLLGEEFDRNPFLLFTLRGLNREELLGKLGGGKAHEPKERGSKKRAANKPAAGSVASVEPLAADHVSFWQGGKLPADFFGEVRIPPVAAALPKRLGTFPFWRGSERFLDALEPIYAKAAQQGLDVFLGEHGVNQSER